MRVHSFLRVIIDLDQIERWRARDDRDLVFEVEKVQWTHGDHATVSGRGIKKDGEYASIHRSQRVRFDSLPRTVQDAITTEANRHRA